jgi:hypothetical protein
VPGGWGVHCSFAIREKKESGMGILALSVEEAFLLLSYLAPSLSLAG